MKIKELESEVVIIGGGAAGCLAALEASKVTENVLILVKGLGGRSGNTPMAEGGIQCCFNEYDTPEEHILDTLNAGCGINNKELVSEMAKKAQASIKSLEEYGVSFKKEEGGDYFQYTSSGSSNPRCLWIKGGGAGLSKPLFNSVKKKGIKYREDFIVTKIFVTENRVNGVLGYDYGVGEIVYIKTKSIVIATGGNESIYYFSDASVDSTGDGISLAYNAGAKLIDMEFMQFYPHSLVHPETLRGNLVPEEVYYDSLIKAKIYNGLGEEFVYKYDPVRKEKTTRDILSRAIYTEIEEGRGTKHNGVIIDATMCDKKEISGLVGPLYNFLLKNGVDMLKEKLEVAPSAHYQCGGILIDKTGKTSVDGLFAAGECTGGFDGANRLSSNALTEAVVFGMICGKNSAIYAKNNKFTINADITDAYADFISLLDNEMKKLDYVKVKVKIQKLMVEKAGVIRTEKSLKEGLEIIKDIKENELNNIYLSNKNLKYNQELIEILELKSLIDNAELLLKSALFRCESRGNHFRKEYTQIDEECFNGSTCISKDRDAVLIPGNYKEKIKL